MAPHIHKENASRHGKAKLAKIVKTKAAPPPTKNVINKKEKNENIVRVGVLVPVEDSGVSLDVVEKLGNGSFGEVFKVCLENDDRCLAMKVVRADTTRQREKADEEADLLREIREHDVSEFILETFFTFWFSRNNQEVICFVSELLDRPMSVMLDDARGSPLSAVVVKAVGYQVLSALDFLHSIGVTHTDIKPDNIMLVDLKNSPLRVKLIDFGLAKHTRTLRQGAKIQNIMYRAPEVVFGLPLTEKMDIWSTAVMLSEIYTGYDLFPAQQEPELARYIEKYVGLPQEVLEGSAPTKYAIYDVDEGRQTVLSYEETQLCGLPDVKEDQREIPSLDKVPDFGHSNLYGGGVTEDDLNFLEVLKKMLKPNTFDRYGAKDALQSPFFGSFDGNYNP